VAHGSALLATVITPWAALSLIALPLTAQVIKTIYAGASGQALIPVLGQVGKVQLLLSTTLAVSLLL
jgi:1,4-dihydroxy-2-naphthoate octaprenyltransferase